MPAIVKLFPDILIDQNNKMIRKEESDFFHSGLWATSHLSLYNPTDDGGWIHELTWWLTYSQTALPADSELISSTVHNNLLTSNWIVPNTLPGPEGEGFGTPSRRPLYDYSLISRYTRLEGVYTLSIPFTTLLNDKNRKSSGMYPIFTLWNEFMSIQHRLPTGVKREKHFFFKLDNIDQKGDDASHQILKFFEENWDYYYWLRRIVSRIATEEGKPVHHSLYISGVNVQRNGKDISINFILNNYWLNRYWMIRLVNTYSYPNYIFENVGNTGDYAQGKYAIDNRNTDSLHYEISSIKMSGLATTLLPGDDTKHSNYVIEKTFQPQILNALSTPETNVNFKNMRYAKEFFGRTFVWGDESNPNIFMTSEIGNTKYFPENSIYKISENANEIIQNMVFYANVVVCFTNFGIYMIKKIEGENNTTLGFQVKLLNGSLGTNFGKSVKVIGNYIYFIGSDARVYYLKSLYNPNQDVQVNVQLIDTKVKSLLSPLLKNIENPDRVFAISHNLEYQIFIGDRRFRYYTERNMLVWTYDQADFFKDVYGALSENGKLYLYHLDGIFSDTKDDEFRDNGEIFEVEITTPKYDMKSPHHPKSFKRLFLQFGDTIAETPWEFLVQVRVDDKLILNYYKEDFVLDNNRELVITKQEVPNFLIENYSGTTDFPTTTKSDWETGEPLEVKQRRLLTSARGYTYQFSIKNRQNKQINFKSLGVAFRKKRVK